MHRRLLHNEKWGWYFSDVIKPLMVVLILSTFARLLLNEGAEKWDIVIVLFITLLITTIAVIGISSTLRSKLSVRQLWAKNK